MTTSPATTGDSMAPRGRRRFRPRLLPTLAAAVLIALFISAGQWQWNKYTAKSAHQAQLDARASQTVIRIPATRVDAQSMHYRKVVARGHYEPEFQVLIDNRIFRSQAGYHVITPVRLEGSDMRLLINRGWIPAPGERNDVPKVVTPAGPVEISGTAIIPGTRFLRLGSAGRDGQNGPLDEPGRHPQHNPRPVWQNLDLSVYTQSVAFPVQPIVIQLAPESDAGGFVREWPRPDERIQTNLGYALQWWTFAATTVALWLVVNFRKIP